MGSDSSLQRPTDGRYVDTRYQFTRGERMLIVAGPYESHIATVESRLFLQGAEGVPGYQLSLNNGKWVSVAWDMVQERAS